MAPFRSAVVEDVPNDVPDRGTHILSQPDNAGATTLDGWALVSTCNISL